MFLGCLPCCGGPWGCPFPGKGSLAIDMEWHASISGVVADSVTRSLYEIPEISSSSSTTSYVRVLPGMTGAASQIFVRFSTLDVVIFLRTYESVTSGPYQLHVTFQYSPCSGNFFSVRRRTYDGIRSLSLEQKEAGYGTTVTDRQASHGGLAWQQFSSDLDHYRLQLADVDNGSFSGQSDIIPITNSWSASTKTVDDTLYSLSASLAIYDIVVDDRSVFRPAFYREGF